MLPYASYLRVYEPVRAFPEPDRSRWRRYADSTARPRRARALDAEHAQALRRLVAGQPPLVPLVPVTESDDAYVRRFEGELYVCPWETRLRSWASAASLVETAPPGLLGEAAVREVLEGLERWRGQRTSIRPYIQSSTWLVPPAWFVPFIPEERWLVLGPGRRSDGGAAVVTPVRTLLYVTSMAHARRRVTRAVRILSGVPEDLGELRKLGGLTQIARLGRWLSEFDPRALVELDYGGLVHLMDDTTLCADQSVGETRVALTAIERGEEELTIAMYSRLRARWRRIQALQAAN